VVALARLLVVERQDVAVQEGVVDVADAEPEGTQLPELQRLEICRQTRMLSTRTIRLSDSDAGAPVKGLPDRRRTLRQHRWQPQSRRLQP
jgi:hypothetical protein